MSRRSPTSNRPVRPASPIAKRKGVPLSPLVQKMLQDMQLEGLSERTHESYLRAVRKFAQWLRLSPDRAAENDLRRYLLFIKNDQQVKLPTVLTIHEVDQLIGAIRKPAMRCFFWTVYSLGLRLQEALYLQVGDIDAGRMLIHVRRGKGHKDRLVPLTPRTLEMLRANWATHRNPQWLLPCVYFLLTFTVPEELRPFVRAHPRACLPALFAAATATLQELAQNPKYVGSSKLGFAGVLHTWGRNLTYHPHVHFIVPGGALSADGQQWLSSRVNFLVPVCAASVIYRAKFEAIMRERGLHDRIPPVVWTKDWVVHSKAVGDGRVALQYLAPYVYRVAISNRRLVKCEPGPDGLGRVTFTFRPSGGRHYRAMTVTAEEFIRRFLQHVLPRGLQKVRHYGFAHPRSRIDREWLRMLVTVTLNQI